MAIDHKTLDYLETRWEKERDIDALLTLAEKYYDIDKRIAFDLFIKYYRNTKKSYGYYMASKCVQSWDEERVYRMHKKNWTVYQDIGSYCECIEFENRQTKKVIAPFTFVF